MAKRTRARARTGNRRESGESFQQLPFRQPQNPYQPFNIISDDEVEALHNKSLDVLEELGINFLLEEARDILKAAGADVRPGDPCVRFDRGLIEASIKTTPKQFTVHARNPAYNMEYGGNYTAFCLVGSPPNATDMDNGRRQGSFNDYCDFIRLGQSLNIVHQIAGYPVEPTDIAPPIRHLVAEQALIKLSDKIGFGYCLNRQRIRDSIEMVRIGRNISEEQLKNEPSIFTVVNANSPRQYDVAMLSGIIEMARMNQPVIITPFTLAGAMAPVTMIGAIVQQNVEALAGIAFLQMVNPGAPALYGGFTSNVDMRTGSPAFGTPEYSKAVLIGGQLTRRYDIPYRSSNVNASNAPDAQATYESQMSLWPCMLAHCNMVKHAVGWLEGGLAASFEKAIIDAEMLQMMSEFMKPLTVNDDEMAMEAMREVGPGGHYFGCAHTMERYENAFYTPILSDWSNFENWRDKGSIDATTRANTIYKKLLEDYQQPPMDKAIEDELDAFVERRIAEGGAKED
ncbi:MAG: trimethylamine methyltransferase family protein [Rhodospirillaceae bacterium]|nr:trimethylamine methyltransferase family protein [Rhodospirillaceae bacterium]MBT5242748.1 trimethylamine methyltransferase family protein [Rhodospirillaceae bacterium]MBT5561561.1 trimethylamine methyltransferase family protein [Rhodospirillaceae bacterium]MBT6241841.1 trimethylamine methyltransferase family protein [Rhodospirillaceae bacterium]MBT7138642.1 trimethylamine methyltransferase family protein [Rhodospirillaceae bacterium]